MVERIVDGGVHAEEALGGCRRLEALHLALSPSHDLVGILGPIIFTEPLVVTTGQIEVSERGVVGRQFVGHDQLGRDAVLSEQLAHGECPALRIQCTRGPLKKWLFEKEPRRIQPAPQV